MYNMTIKIPGAEVTHMKAQDPKFAVAVHRIVRFCSEECDRQRSGEISVANMFDAWMWVIGTKPAVSVQTILKIGAMVEPQLNKHGFRTVPVRIVHDIRKVVDFERVLTTLCESPLTSDASEFFREFEMVHPFVDGNGRTGAILYNSMLGRLDFPNATP